MKEIKTKIKSKPRKHIPTRYIGIDLSTSAEEIGACTLTEFKKGELELTDSPITVCFRGSSEKAIVHVFDFIKNRTENFSGQVILALDVPFGWPKDFSGAVAEHKVGRSFGKHPRTRYRYRETDLVVQKLLASKLPSKGTLNPLSVSTDRLGLTAIWASDLIERVQRELDFEIDLGSGSNSDRKLIEVYPSASIALWSPIEWTMQRNQSGEAKTVNLKAAVLSHANRYFSTYPVTTNEMASRNHLDAFVCAITAKSYQENKCSKPEYISKSTLQKEGWIWAPIE